MLIDKKIKIKITNKNIGYYKNIGYNLNSGNIVEVKVEDLPETSKTKINVKCDVCGKIKSISNYSYKRNILKYNFYACSQKCAYSKNISTNMEKYGI